MMHYFPKLGGMRYGERTDPAKVVIPVLSHGIQAGMDKMAISPGAIAEAIAFGLGQPSIVDVGEIVVPPTAQA